MSAEDLTVMERRRLAVLREEIAAGKRGTEDLDGPDVSVLAYYRFLEQDPGSCGCGRSDGERCHCRDP